MSDEQHPTFAVPERVAFDGNGYGWRVFADHWSMVPTTPDNEPTLEPLTWFVRAELLGEVVDWFGAPDWSGPPLPKALADRIAAALAGTDAPVGLPDACCGEHLCAWHAGFIAGTHALTQKVRGALDADL